MNMTIYVGLEFTWMNLPILSDLIPYLPVISIRHTYIHVDIFLCLWMKSRTTYMHLNLSTINGERCSRGFVIGRKSSLQNHPQQAVQKNILRDCRSKYRRQIVRLIKAQLISYWPSFQGFIYDMKMRFMLSKAFSISFFIPFTRRNAFFVYPMLTVKGIVTILTNLKLKLKKKIVTW